MKFQTNLGRFGVLILLLSLSACGSYRQNVMLRTPEGFKGATLEEAARKAQNNYVIQKNDYLRLEVYSNKGEKIIDPNPELSNPNANTFSQGRPVVQFLVDHDGNTNFPVVGQTHVEGMTLQQAEAMLRTEFDKYFRDAFVVLTFANKRVVVLGAVGGQVVPLINQQVRLSEVLAASKVLPNDAKVNNIRVVRGEQVFLVDLSTVEGFQKGNMILEPNDIIYVEPVRRPFAEGLRDYAGLASLVISALSLIIVIRSVK